MRLIRFVNTLGNVFCVNPDQVTCVYEVNLKDKTITVIHTNESYWHTPQPIEEVCGKLTMSGYSTKEIQ